MTRRNLLIAGGACLVLLIAWYLLLWSPKGKELDEASSRRSEAQQQAEQLEIRLARLQAAQQDAPRLMAQLDRLRSAVPSSPDLAQFLLDADAAATKAGVDFLSISPSPPAAATAPGAPAEIRLAIDVKGGYFQLLDYLDRLLDLPRVVVVDRVQVSPESSGSNAPNLAVSLTARMFLVELPATTAPPAPAAPGAPTTTTTAPAQVAAGAPTSREAGA